MDQERLEQHPPAAAMHRPFRDERERLLRELGDLEREEALLHGRRAHVMNDLRRLAIEEHRRTHGELAERGEHGEHGAGSEADGIGARSGADDARAGADDADSRDIALDDMTAEICALRRLSRGVVEVELERSRMLCTELPRLDEAIGGGAIGPRHTAAILAEAAPVITAHHEARGRLEAAERRDEPEAVLGPLRDEVARTADACAEFERSAVDWADDLTPAAVRRRCRRLAARVTAATADERHVLARRTRGLRLFDLADGTSELIATVPTVLATAMHDRLSQQAAALGRVEGEVRTFDQLRADLFADLLLTSEPSAPHGAARGIDATIAITVPALSVLGADTDPAMLNGVTPIPMQDALRFAAEAPSWLRVLTDPFTGVAREVESYRPSAALRALVGARDLTCRFPGCSRAAHRSDLDHALAWADGGTTSEPNLQGLCRFHHTMKHHGEWTVDADPGRPGVLVWTSPSGRRYIDHPPPVGPVFTPSSTPRPPTRHGHGATTAGRAGPARTGPGAPPGDARRHRRADTGEPMPENQAGRAKFAKAASQARPVSQAGPASHARPVNHAMPVSLTRTASQARPPKPPKPPDRALQSSSNGSIPA